MEAIQFENCRPDFQDRIWGLFGEQDTLAHFEPLFLEHYKHSFHFPGGHTSQAVIPRQPKKSVAGMCRWPKKCWN